MNRVKTIMNLAASVLLVSACAVGSVTSENNTKTTFQTSRGWMPEIDNRADAVMVYGVMIWTVVGTP